MVVEEALANATNSTINSTADALGNLTINTTAILDAFNSTIDKTKTFVDSTSFSGPSTSTLVLVFVGIVALIFIFTLLMKGLNLAITLALNSAIGFFALYAIQLFWLQNLLINIWSVAIVATLGLVGFIIVLILHGVGYLF